MTAAAPLYADIAHGPNGGQAAFVTTADGVQIRLAHWAAPTARGTVLLFPGRTEYIEKYGPAALDLQTRGYATVVIDWRGQGLADRLHTNRALGHVGNFGDYQHDVRAMVAHARGLNLPEPFFLLGHSMGGAIGLRALMQGMPVQAAAFSAPMWGIMMAPALRPVAWTMSSVARPLGFGHVMAPGQSEKTYVLRTTFADNTLTNDPAMFAMMQDQMTAQPDLSLGGPSLHWLNESLLEMRALSRRPSPATPCLTFLGSQESIVDPSRITARMAVWPGGQLVPLKDCKHEVMMEGPAVRAQVFDQIAGHFDNHREHARAAG